MSTVYEGILCTISIDEARLFVSRLSSSLSLKAERITNLLSAISRFEKTRDQLLFSPEIENVASQLSVAISSALLVRYDDRVGYRSSILFQEGLPTKSFDEADEIWVLTDEEGEPIIDGEKFTIEQIKDDDQEYETICNAIQLGLNALEVGNWSEVHSFITHPSC